MRRTTLVAYTISSMVSLFLTSGPDSKELTSAESDGHAGGYSQLLPREELYLHNDRDKYIAGEDIWFSVYCIDGVTGKLSSRSSVAYIELLNPWNVAIMQMRLKLSGGRGEGNFALPDSINSGTYTLRAYTNWMKNFLPDNCFMSDIDILNPFRGSGFRRKENLMNNMTIRETVFHQNKGGAVILTKDSIFGRREKVTIKLGTVNNQAGQSVLYDMSIAVVPAGISGRYQGLEEYINGRQKKWGAVLSGKKILPQYKFESDGHYLSVLIKYREEDISDSSKYIYMSIQGKVAEFRYAGRDTAGRFTFLLPVDDKYRNLILQPDHANNNMILEVEPSFSRIMPVSRTLSDTLTYSELDLFSKLSFNYQAAKIYGIKLKKEVVSNDKSNLKIRRFYGIPEKEIYLDDYIRLPSMEEVFFELLPGIILKSGNRGYEMRITNPLTGVYYNEQPLVMIDGVIINNLKVLVDLNPETVEKIEVVKSPYLIGDVIFHGIVNVITRSGNFSNLTMPEYAAILPYRVIDKASGIISPDYSDIENRQSRTPDLRNTLYWNPSVKTGSNGEVKIEFWTSDLPGNYMINVQGISGAGEKVSLYKSFTVR